MREAAPKAAAPVVAGVAEVEVMAAQKAVVAVQREAVVR